MTRKQLTKIINEEAMKYFLSLGKEEQESFIIKKVKRSKDFKNSLNPKQKEVLFSYDENGEYVYPMYSKPLKSAKQEQKKNIYNEIRDLFEKLESAFKNNSLHFSKYGMLCKYKKQIMKNKEEINSLKQTKTKGLENIKNAILIKKETEKRENQIKIIYKKILKEVA